jgi:hypothetical protein
MLQLKQLPPTAPDEHEKCIVYVIGDRDVFFKALSVFLSDWDDKINVYFLDLYVGITEQARKRFNDNCMRNTRKNQHIAEIINEKQWTRQENMWPIFEGDKDTCNNIEYNLRTRANTGLNTKVGGTSKTDRYHTSMNEIRKKVIKYLKKHNAFT